GVGQAGLQHGAVIGQEPRPLPGGIVRVLEGQRTERRRPPRAERPVEGGHLADEDADRPAVGGDVVEVDDEDVLVAREADEREAQERAGREVERPPRLGQRRGGRRRPSGAGGARGEGRGGGQGGGPRGGGGGRPGRAR